MVNAAYSPILIIGGPSMSNKIDNVKCDNFVYWIDAE
jgi:hypothetical protein